MELHGICLRTVIRAGVKLDGSLSWAGLSKGRCGVGGKFELDGFV